MKMIEFGQCRNVGDEIFMKRRWKRHFWGHFVWQDGGSI